MRTVSLLNLHEDERSKPGAWIFVGWIPIYDENHDSRPWPGFHSSKDGEAPHDQWIDTQGTELPPNCLCPVTLEDEISLCDDKGTCMGIQLNIWERAKKRQYLLW